MNKKLLVLLLLSAILIIAVFFRFWQLDKIPPGLYPDVAINGNNALDSIKNNDYKIFYPDNNGREGLIMWLAGLSFTLFGVSVWSLKVIAAFFGVLTVLGAYLLSKQLFSQLKDQWKAEAISLLSAFFIAISFWHVLMSRIGFRAILVPFFLVYGFYFLWRGLNFQKIYNFIISGIFFGLGFYTYISYRFVPFLFLIIAIPWFFICKKRGMSKQFLLFIVLCSLFTILVALPLGIYFLNNPGDFFGRAADVSILKQANPLLQFGKSIAGHLAMFNISGDANWRHNFSGAPELLFPVGIFFLIGLILSVIGLIKSLKCKNYSLFSVYCFLISWFIIFLAPGFLSAEGVPHALRTIGVIPIACIFAGIGAYWLYSLIKKLFRNSRSIFILYLSVAVFLSALTYAEFYRYFILWGQNTEVLGAYTDNLYRIGEYLNSLPPSFKKYVIVNSGGVAVPYPNGIPMPAQTPIFIERTANPNPTTIYLKADELKNIKAEGETAVVLMQYDKDMIAALLSMFPEGKFESDLFDMNGFWVYEFNKPLAEETPCDKNCDK